MANIKSAKKRILTSERNARRNRWYKLRMKNIIKDALSDHSKIREAISLIDKAASKNVISQNKASHKKSQLMKLAKA